VDIYPGIGYPAGAETGGTCGYTICPAGGKRNSERKVFIYTYPDLREAGTLRMDLPPWDAQAGTRIWPNIVELPEGYATKYIALIWIVTIFRA
jgi:hypothetical protein